MTPERKQYNAAYETILNIVEDKKKGLYSASDLAIAIATINVYVNQLETKYESLNKPAYRDNISI